MLHLFPVHAQVSHVTPNAYRYRPYRLPSGKTAVKRKSNIELKKKLSRNQQASCRPGVLFLGARDYLYLSYSHDFSNESASGRVNTHSPE